VTRDKTVYTRKDKHNVRVPHEADDTRIRRDT